MSFKLLIECSKDIDELHINFSDGTTSTVEKPKQKPIEKAPKSEIKKPKEQKITKKVDNDYSSDETNDADWDSYLGEKNVEKISPPFVPDIDREVNVAGEMKNAEF